MGSLTYPVKHPEGKITNEQLHAMLGNARLIAKRVADVTKMRFIADYLLQGRLDATGGGVFYETGEDGFAGDAKAELIAPNAEYPLAILDSGETVAAKTGKWGLDTLVTDEKIARQGRVPVDRAFARLGNTVVRDVDSVAMAVIASKITSTIASGAWATAGAAVEAIMTAAAEREALGLGIDLSTVVLRPAQYAKIIGMLVDDKALPRESGANAVNGNLPVDALGVTWATTPHFVGTDPLLIDREQLGGMADEKLGGPGYVAAGNVGIEVKTIRNEDSDGYRLRARRVTVPVVLEPLAGARLTGTGL